ncbi:MAG: ribokinase [Zoogloeaceae bacterium]|jgi:ribokinase|nr:ribokinase [Zoogloeaceae bacterium]
MSGAHITVIGSFMQAACWQVERLPKPGETLAASGFYTEPAGKGLAVAVGCRRLGAEVDLLLSIGDDAAGDALMQRLPRDFDLPTDHVRRHPGPSGQGAGWLAADGENAIAAYLGANALLDAEQVAQADAALARSTLVYAQFEAPLSAAREAFTRARRRGACSVLNPSPWQPLPADLLACTQVLLLNMTEAARLLPYWPPAPQPGQRAALAAMLEPLWRTWPGGGERVLVVTLNAGGSLAFTPDGASHFAPALNVPARSSIGAGDAFAAGLCIALSQRRSLEEALRQGNACGAFAVMRTGILEGLPSEIELRGMLEGRFSSL